MMICMPGLLFSAPKFLVFIIVLGPIAGFCEHSNEPLGSIKDKFLE
jgi:hypothetical protein